MLIRAVVLLCVFLIGLFMTGCGMDPVEIHQPSQTPAIVTQLVTVLVVETPTPKSFSLQITPLSISASVTKEPWLLPDEAANFVGQVVSVRIETVWCSYRAEISGSPTFCNDQLYPNHNFTFLMWGEDLSSFDQRCVVVEGLVEMYQGKPQIEVIDQDQLQFCEN